ncbi:MAG TPA: metallophosphoesterase [Candidatus Moranbacteria bacterium]|nr:metallophosphoesterase [Candidatus Moranbacteria bacterium]
MDELKKKSIKSHLLPFLSLLVVLAFIFFYQYPKSFEKFLGVKQEEQKTAPAEIILEPKNIATSQNEKQEIKPESNQEEVKTNDANKDATVPEETAKKETSEEEAPRPDLTVGIIADAHAGQAHGFSSLNSAVWVFRNQVQPDIIVDLGDLIESRTTKGYISKKDAEVDYRKASGILSAFPTYHTVGNHELLSMSKDNVASLTGRKNRYTANAKGYQIIVLDGNYTGEEDHIDAKHDDTFIYTGTITSGALEWLEAQLKQSSKNLIFIHHPLWNLSNKNKVEKILSKNKERIVMVANGHKHPATLGVITFGGVKNYNIPSAYHQRSVAVAKINGNSAVVSVKKY